MTDRESTASTEGGATTEAAPATSDLIQLLMEDRRAMQANMEALMRVVERTHATEAEPVRTTASRPKVADLKLSKLTESDDIEAYLATFERMMEAYEVEERRWAFQLAPQLTGKAQQAYAAMPQSSAGKYADVKAAILRRYDINEETYHQRFRGVARKENETYRELAVRVVDLLTKWMKEYMGDVQRVLEQVAIEQLLSTLPRDVHIWVRERKPETVIKAGQLADDYALARKQMIGITNTDQKTDVQQQPEVVRCQYCNKKGHLARECRKAAADQARKNEGTQDATKFRRDRSAVR